MTDETGWNASAIADEAMHSLNGAAWSQNDDNAALFHIADPIGRALVAQALATLSLAEEQSTAYLLAYLAIAEQRGEGRGDLRPRRQDPRPSRPDRGRGVPVTADGTYRPALAARGDTATPTVAIEALDAALQAEGENLPEDVLHAVVDRLNRKQR